MVQGELQLSLLLSLLGLSSSWAGHDDNQN